MIDAMHVVIGIAVAIARAFVEPPLDDDAVQATEAGDRMCDGGCRSSVAMKWPPTCVRDCIVCVVWDILHMEDTCSKASFSWPV